MKGNKRKQKGITLIALIITIIVMLILVGVTINVALNGGLFTQAQTATKETQKETEREQLLSVAVAAVGADGKVDSTKVVLPSGFEKDEEKTTNSKLVVKGKKSQITWQIDLNTIEIKEYEERETYSFTLNSINTAYEKVADSAMEFDNDKVWEILGENLSQNSTYCVNQGVFMVEPSNDIFQDMLEIFLGNEMKETTLYTITVCLEGGTFIIQILDRNNNEIIDEDNRQDFLAQYGDVVFTFKDVTEIELPE